jgi:hypothetical protein
MRSNLENYWLQLIKEKLIPKGVDSSVYLFVVYWTLFVHGFFLSLYYTLSSIEIVFKINSMIK